MLGFGKTPKLYLFTKVEFNLIDSKVKAWLSYICWATWPATFLVPFGYDLKHPLQIGNNLLGVMGLFFLLDPVDVKSYED
jgi:hypothetical protein